MTTTDYYRLSARVFVTIVGTLFAVWTAAYGEGPGVSGGGDPNPVMIKEFPKPRVLNSAIQYLQTKIAQAPYSTLVRQAFRSELDALQNTNNFKYIEDTVVLGHNRYTGDYQTLVTVGAFTQPQPGATIYLTKQVLNYSPKRLAQVIAQELPHHLLRKPLSRDEEVVNAVGDAFIAGQALAFGESMLDPEIVKADKNFFKNLEESARLSGCQIADGVQISKMTYKNWMEMLGLLPQDLKIGEIPLPLNQPPEQVQQNLQCLGVVQFWLNQYFSSDGTPEAAAFAHSINYIYFDEARLKEEGRLRTACKTTGMTVTPAGPIEMKMTPNFRYSAYRKNIKPWFEGCPPVQEIK